MYLDLTVGGICFKFQGEGNFALSLLKQTASSKREGPSWPLVEVICEQLKGQGGKGGRKTYGRLTLL